MSTFSCNKIYTPLSDVRDHKVYTTILGTNDYISKTDTASNPTANGNVSFNNISQNNNNTIFSKKAFLKYTYKIVFNGHIKEDAGVDKLINAGYDAPSYMPIHSTIESAKVKINGVMFTYLIAENFRFRSKYFNYENVNKSVTSSYCFPDTFENFKDAFQTVEDPLATINDNINFVKYPPRGCIHNLEILENTDTQCILRFEAIEPCLFPPFITKDNVEEGIYNISSLDITLNHVHPNMIWSHNDEKTVIDNMNVIIEKAQFEYSQAALPMGIETPMNCICPTFYHDLKTTTGYTVRAGQSATLTSQNIVLNSIPDYILVWACEDKYSGSVNDIVTRTAGSVCAPESIRVQLGTSKPLMNDLTQHQLYNQMVLSGLDMDYNHFKGEVKSLNGNVKYLCSAPVKLVPGLSAFNDGIKIVSGMKCNENLNISLTFKNTSSIDKNINLYCLFVYNGVLNITKDGKPEEVYVMYNDINEVMAAPLSDESIDDILYNAYGGSFWDKLKTGVKNVGKFIKNNQLISKGLDTLSGYLPDGISGIVKGISDYASSKGYGVVAGSMAGSRAGSYAGKMIDYDDLYN